MKNLYLGVLLAPYRLDYYNYMALHMNYEFYFLFSNADDILFSVKDLEKQCVFTPHYLETINIFKGRRVVRNLKKIVDQLQPDSIIVPEFSLLTIQVILLKKLYGYKFKVVSQCDDSYAMLEGEGFSKDHAWARNFCMKHLDDLILLDAKATEWYQQHYQKGIFMPLILDEGRMEKEILILARKKALELKKSYQLPDQQTMLYVGRLVDVKNLFRLIDACARLEVPYKLVIVGDGVLRKELEEYAASQHIHVLFAGAYTGVDLYAWYCVADVFVLPSTIEPFGSVTNEALLCGCTCCISEVAGSACLIEPGKNGYLLNPQSVEDMAQQLERSLSLAAMDKDKTNKMLFSFTEYIKHMQTAIERL